MGLMSASGAVSVRPDGRVVRPVFYPQANIFIKG